MEVPAPVTVITDNRVLVLVHKVPATPESYPQRAGAPAKRPLRAAGPNTPKSAGAGRGQPPLVSRPQPLLGYSVTSKVDEALPEVKPPLEAVASTVYVPTPSRLELTL